MSQPAPAPDPWGGRPEITRAPATCLAVGLAAGLGSALLGIGGGLIMVPGMVWLLRIRQHRAVGTSLAVIIPTALAAVYQYRLGGEDLVRVFFLALGGVFGAVLGARLAAALRGAQLRRIFGLFVLLTGLLMILLPARLESAHAMSGPEWPIMLVTGVGVGVVSGLLGVGGGLIMVPVLVLLLGLSQKEAQGISLAVILPVSLSGVLVHARRGNVVASLFNWLAIGAVIGAMTMGHYVQRIEDQFLRTLFGAFICCVGASMLMRREAARPQQSAEGGTGGQG